MVLKKEGLDFYEPGSTFLGLKVNTNKTLKTAVIAISSRITLLKSTVEEFDSNVKSGRGCQIGEYPNEKPILLLAKGYPDIHGT